MTLRQTVLTGARRAGLEPQLRRAQRTLARGASRRGYIDDEHTTLLMRLGLPADSQCIDVGANVGTVLDDIVSAHPQARHLAFEPLPDLAADLRARFPTVEVRTAALSDRSGTDSFTRVIAAPGHSSLAAEPGDGASTETLEVRLEALDETLPDGFAPAFVKIDVEGAEAQALRGMLTTLRTFRPMVVLEHGDHAARFGTTHGEIHDIIVREAGLRLFDIDGGGPFDRATFERRATDGGIWTWVARS
jgi:FkbM family methyltransferase